MRIKYQAGLWAMFIVPLSGILVNAQDQKAWQATAVSINDNRVQDIVPRKISDAGLAKLTVHLKITGPGADQAAAYGKVKISHADDDAGESLVPEVPILFGNQSDDMTTIDAMSRKMRHDMGEDGIEVELSLNSPKRAATKLTDVSGTVVVRAGGKQQLATTANLPALEHKKINDPALTAAGVSAEISSAPANARSVEIVFTGSLTAIADVQLLDSTGNNLISGSGTSSFNGEEHAQYDLSAPLDPAMKLQITVVASQQDVTVPFELKNIPLP